MIPIKVSAAIAAIQAVADKFPEALVTYYNVGFKTEAGDINLSSPSPLTASTLPAQEPAPTGEAPAAKKSRAKPAAAPAETAKPSAASAAESELFGSASEDTTPAKQQPAATTTTATTSASPSDSDDLFGETAAPAKDKPKATIEQLRKALTECQTKHGHKDHALGVLKKYTRDGNPTISTLDEAKYQDVIDACGKYVPAK